MTPERSQAYGRVSRTLEDVGPAKLHPEESDAIREVADTLLFAATVIPALDELEQLAVTVIEPLVESGRWTAESARRLLDDLSGCAPSIVKVLA